MEQITSLFDLLYSRFILRDVFAKAFPGTLLLISVFLAFGGQPVNLVDKLVKIAQANWLLLTAVLIWLYAASFVTGMLLQSVGQFVGMKAPMIGIWIHPKHASSEGLKQWYKIVKKVAPETVSTHERTVTLQQRERFTVLKEATGNTGYALLLSFLALAIGHGLGTNLIFVNAGILRSLAVYVVVLLTAVLLVIENHYHYSEQSTWEEAVLGSDNR
jgi:hypothetical protein